MPSNPKLNKNFLFDSPASAKAPKIGAKKFRLNTIKRGLDNNKWVCSKRRNGTKYWRKLDDLSHVKSK